MSFDLGLMEEKSKFYAVPFRQILSSVCKFYSVFLFANYIYPNSFTAFHYV